jgi:two-component system, response regulator
MAENLVLLVEDNPDDIELARRAFERGDIQVTLDVVTDGALALEYLFGRRQEDNGGRASLPSLILLDLRLPRLDAIEVLKRIRSEEHTRLIPVVIFTSSIEEIDVVNSYTNGANSYIRKPIDFGELMDLIKVLKKYWLTLNQRPPRIRSRREN